MGVIRRGILGGFSGKVANVIGGSWKGIAYMRSQPLSVANPNTAGQVAQRGAFTQIVIVAKVLLSSVLKPLNDRFAQAMSGYNRFVQMSIEAFDTSGLSDASKFKISEGSLLGETVSDITTSLGDKNLAFTHSNSTGTGNALASDEVYGVAYAEEDENWGFSAANTDRSEGAAIIAMPTDVEVGDTITVWMALRKADGTLASNTSYLTKELTA